MTFLFLPLNLIQRLHAMREGATIFPSVLAGLLECEKYDLFERIFTNRDFQGDKIAILSEPWHGGSFTGHYEGISPDDEDDFCVIMNLSSSHDHDDENPTTTKLTFTKSWKFVSKLFPISFYLDFFAVRFSRDQN